MQKITTLSFLIFLLFISCKKREPEKTYLVVLSLDGFRWDYASRTNTPNLDYIAANGVKAKSLKSSFPTTTFANHFTMATGLHPDHHGIIANRFFASDLDEYYNTRDSRSTVEDGRFYGGEPIWVTAEQQNVTSATCFWVGSEATIQGIQPTYWKKYDHDMPFEARIDTVIHWLQLEEAKRPQLVMWYMDEPDSRGHRLGPENDSLLPLVSQLDSLVGVFITKLKKLPYYDKINFLVVSDHGMAQINPEKIIELDTYIDTSLIVHSDGWNPVMNFLVKEGKKDSLLDQLSKVPHITYWERGSAPEELHYGTHIRTHDVTVLANDSYSIYWSWANSTYRGTHGYHNANPDMHGIFYAMGPSFNKGYEKNTFQNIHLYPLMAEVLHLQPAVTDGKLDSIGDILKK